MPKEAGAGSREGGEIMDAGNGPEPPDSLETSRYRSREPQVGEESGGVGGAGTSPSTRELAMRSLRQNFPRAAAAYDEQAAALPPSSCAPSAPPADEGSLASRLAPPEIAGDLAEVAGDLPAPSAEPKPAAPPAAPRDSAADASAKPQKLDLRESNDSTIQTISRMNSKPSKSSSNDSWWQK